MTLIEKLEELKASNMGEIVNADWAIDDCIDIVKSHSDWISVSEPPKLETPVLVYNYGNTRVLTLCKLNDGFKWIDEFGQDEFELNEIDFWQPLPQPPSEVQND